MSDTHPPGGAYGRARGRFQNACGRMNFQVPGWVEWPQGIVGAKDRVPRGSLPRPGPCARARGVRRDGRVGAAARPAAIPRALAPGAAPVELRVPERDVKPKDACWMPGSTACVASSCQGKSCCGRGRNSKGKFQRSVHELLRSKVSSHCSGNWRPQQQQPSRPGLVAMPSSTSIRNPEAGGVRRGVISGRFAGAGALTPCF